MLILIREKKAPCCHTRHGGSRNLPLLVDSSTVGGVLGFAREKPSPASFFSGVPHWKCRAGPAHVAFVFVADMDFILKQSRIGNGLPYPLPFSHHLTYTFKE